MKKLKGNKPDCYYIKLGKDRFCAIPSAIKRDYPKYLWDGEKMVLIDMEWDGKRMVPVNKKEKKC